MSILKTFFITLFCLFNLQNNGMVVWPLPVAAQRGDVERVRALIVQARRIGKLEKILAARDWAGWTALHFAASSGHSAVVQLLLQAGADPNAVDIRGSTPLHEIAYNKHVEMEKVLETIALLIEAKAKVDVRDSDFWPPLCLAARRLDAELIIRVLKEAGARDPRGDFPSRIIVPVSPMADCHRPELLPPCPY